MAEKIRITDPIVRSFNDSKGNIGRPENLPRINALLDVFPELMTTLTKAEISVRLDCLDASEAKLSIRWSDDS